MNRIALVTASILAGLALWAAPVAANNQEWVLGVGLVTSGSPTGSAGRR